MFDKEKIQMKNLLCKLFSTIKMRFYYFFIYIIYNDAFKTSNYFNDVLVDGNHLRAIVKCSNFV